MPALGELHQRERPAAASRCAQAASCQTEVILPWSKDKLVDEKFPSTGPVYQELPKPFPGLAGESRSGDANGQWFRVLAAGGTNLVDVRPRRLRHDRAAAARRQPAEAEGAPAAERRRAVREPADAGPALRRPARRPSSARSTPTTPPFKARWADVRKYGIDLMRLSLKREGLADKFKVVDKDITLDDIKKIAKANDK